MNGNNLIQRIRIRLRDVSTVVDQGNFWSNAEILLTLNATQMAFCNYAIHQNRLYLLSNLIVQLPRQQFTNNQTFALPNNYMHYSSALVEARLSPITIWDRRTCRIYIGGEAESYRYVKHDACFIIRNNYEFRTGIVPSVLKVQPLIFSSFGHFNYYRYPNPIIVGNFSDEFRQDIYEDLFINFTSVILALKEVQTQREFKDYKQFITEQSYFSEVFSNYVENRDGILIKQNPQGQQGQ